MQKKLEVAPAEAAEKIEQMAKEGSVFRVSTPDGPLYVQPNFLMGIYEWHVKAVDKDVAEYADDYYEAMFEQHWKDLKTKQLRIVPVDQSIETKDIVRSYDVIRDLVKGNGLGPYAVAPCICRVEQEQKGAGYSRPLETCLDRCQLSVITEQLLSGAADETALSVDTDRCIGCGLCVPSCPEEAVKLQLKTELPYTPKNGLEMEELMLAERTK